MAAAGWAAAAAGGTFFLCRQLGEDEEAPAGKEIAGHDVDDALLAFHPSHQPCRPPLSPAGHVSVKDYLLVPAFLLPSSKI